MQCIVYRLYDSDGNRLPTESAQANGVSGWLIYRLKAPGTGTPFCHAALLPARGAPEHFPVIPRLAHAKFMRCDGGLRFVGQEWDVHHRYIKQGWWVVPVPQPDIPEAARRPLAGPAPLPIR
jgi:hypothetical protein